ncbi:MAG: hypothetical protein CMJ36_05065 [Phycisphaerae bacterium]|nr:hypothetical protein [Phycisphaerae bacterium]
MPAVPVYDATRAIHEERARVMKSRSLAFTCWVFLLVAVVSWITWFIGDLGWISLVVAAACSIVFGVLFFLQLFE